MRAAKELWAGFHAAWTACVGTPDYDKKVWLDAEKQLAASVESQKDVCIVLWWKYGDGSGMGIERVYTGPGAAERSQKDCDLLNKDSGRQWMLSTQRFS